MILDKIVQQKKQTLESRFAALQPTSMQPIAKRMRMKEDLFIIGELKKASPSKGIIVKSFDVSILAAAYEKAQVDAISILSESHYFQGDIDHIKRVRQQVTCPILRKDFIIDAREIIETKRCGADLLLLIVALLDDNHLRQFYQMAYALGLECIVEVHDAYELQRALQIQPQIIGINNRNLQTFDVCLDTTRTLIHQIPDSICVVAESGIVTPEDFQKIKDAGADAVLIGESFMRSEDFTAHLQWLRHG